MRHHKAEAWEEKLDQAMEELDHYLEDKYGDRYILHPARPKEGKTADPASNGLFGVSANFTLGYGSEKGKGYVVDVRMVTLQPVEEAVRDTIEQVAIEKLQDLLPKYFPETHLNIHRDGPVIKIYGDLSLGTA